MKRDDRWKWLAAGWLLWALAGLGLAAVALLAGGCAFHVTMTHQLKAPIVCKHTGGLGLRCEHEKPAQVLQPHPGSDVPPL